MQKWKRKGTNSEKSLLEGKIQFSKQTELNKWFLSFCLQVIYSTHGPASEAYKESARPLNSSFYWTKISFCPTNWILCFSQKTWVALNGYIPYSFGYHQTCCALQKMNLIWVIMTEAAKWIKRCKPVSSRPRRIKKKSALDTFCFFNCLSSFRSTTIQKGETLTFL